MVFKINNFLIFDPKILKFVTYEFYYLSLILLTSLNKTLLVFSEEELTLFFKY